MALLDMDASLVDHAHPHCHLIFKAAGVDQDFVVGGRTVPLRQDTLVAVNSWQQHAYLHRAGPERTVFLALYIEPEWLAAADHAFADCATPGFFPQAAMPLTREIAQLRARLVECMIESPCDRAEHLQETILGLCLEVSHGFSKWSSRGANRGRTRADFRIGRAIRHMRDGADEPLDLDGIAKVAGLSRPHFNHLFRHCTGLSPRVYLNAIRVEAAVDRLRRRSSDIGHIADDLGFSAQSNFTRFFRQHTGTSPNQFRRVMADLG